MLKNSFQAAWRRASRNKQPDFRQSFSEFSKSLTLIVDLEQLKDNVISKVRELIEVDTTFMYLLNPDLNRYEVAKVRGFPPGQESRFYFHPDEPLIRWFAVNETHLIISERPEVFSYFTDREQKIIRESDIDFIFPLIAMNRIIGLVCCSSRLSCDKFTDKEIAMISMFLTQASLAIENAFLYQQQKLRLRKMYRADRLATLGQLAAGAAHEIRNPLTSIRSTIQYLQKDLQEVSKRNMIADLIEEVDRINEIIEGLLSFSKPAQLQREQVDLELLLQQTLSLVETTAKKGKIRTEFNFNASKKYLTADPAQLKQLFLNIVMNALDAMQEGGKLEITTELNQKPGQLARESHDFFYIEFRDSGEGISRENLDHIFDPFFTTKKDGTGLGLSISYGIVRRHHGDIEIESSTKSGRPEGRGTKVTITLPVVEP